MPTRPLKSLLARTEDRSRPEDHIAETESISVFSYYLLLLELSESVSVETLLGRIFQRAAFIQQLVPLQT